MLYTVKVDMSVLSKIQPFCGSFVDVVCSGRNAIFCAESGQSFVQVAMPIIGAITEQPPNVRIDTTLLFTVGVDGLVKFQIGDSSVEISFFGNSDKLIYKIVVPRQVSYNDIVNKNKLLEKSQLCERHYLNKESKLIRMVSKVKSPFIVEDGFAYMYYKYSYVFQKTELPAFCCDSELLRKCTSITTEFRLCEDYLIFNQGPLTVFIHKQRAPLVSDLGLISRMKASRVLEVNLFKMAMLTSKLKAADYDIKLNLDLKVCLVTSSVNRFEIPIEIISDSGAKMSEDDALALLDEPSEPMEIKSEVLNIPYWVAKILERTSKINIYVTKRFYLLKMDNIVITINGSKQKS